MTNELAPIDISNVPDLMRLAEEVAASGKPRVLRREDVDIAILMPVAAVRQRKVRVKTEADYEAFRAAAGSWEDVDTDRLIEDIYTSRRSSRPPVDL